MFQLHNNTRYSPVQVEATRLHDTLGHIVRTKLFERILLVMFPFALRHDNLH